MLWMVVQVRKSDKEVLVRMGENTRPVFFSTVITDTEPLMQAIRVTFADVLQPGQDFFLQLRRKEWDNAFVDSVGCQEVANRSVVRAVMKPVTKVSHLVF